MALTVKRIAKLTAAGRYADGDNLFSSDAIRRGSPGSSSISSKGANGHMGLGPLKDFALDEARARARAARQQLRDGSDPVETRAAERAQQAAEAAKAKTFEAAAMEYFNGHPPKWTNEHYRGKFLS